MSTRFSFILDPAAGQQHRPENRIILETPSFAVVPSLGSLVPGWLLVVPKRPLLNCGRLTECERDELTVLVADLRQRLKVFPGQVFAFEHGSSEFGTASGCGVDQAHLHVVPLSFDVIEAARDRPDVSWNVCDRQTVGESIARAPVGEYLLMHNCETGLGALGQPDRPTSQWVRRVIATELGRAADWNYRTHEGHANIAETLDRLTLPA